MRDIFKELIKLLGYNSETQFAKDIGVKPNRMSTFFTSRVKYPRLDIIINTKAKFENVNLNALFGYGGPLLFSDEEMEDFEQLELEGMHPHVKQYVEELKSKIDHYEKEIDLYRKQNQQLHTIIEKLQS